MTPNRRGGDANNGLLVLVGTFFLPMQTGAFRTVPRTTLRNGGNGPPSLRMSLHLIL